MIDWLGGPLTLAEEQFLAVSGFLLAIFIFGKFMEIREAKKKHQEWKNNRIRGQLFRKPQQCHLEVSSFGFFQHLAYLPSKIGRCAHFKPISMQICIVTRSYLMGH